MPSDTWTVDFVERTVSMVDGMAAVTRIEMPLAATSVVARWAGLVTLLPSCEKCGL